MLARALVHAHACGLALAATAACSAGTHSVAGSESASHAPLGGDGGSPSGSSTDAGSHVATADPAISPNAPPTLPDGGVPPPDGSPPGDPSPPDPTAGDAPPPAGDPNASAPNAPASPPAPTWTFDQNTLSTSGDDAQQYPTCLTCGTQYYYRVDGCPSAGVGTKRPCQSYCHVKYGTPISYYLDDPPASGNHYPSPEHRLGEHASPVARGYYVHSMEHGAVVLLYNCPDGCDPELALLRQALSQRSRSGDKVIMTPDPQMHSSRFAAVSWTWIYTFDQPDVPTLLCFIDQHQNHGRENKPL